MDPVWSLGGQTDSSSLLNGVVLGQESISESTVESSGSNVLAERTSNLPNDLRAVKDIAANSNCKNYIGFRRGMAFGRLCFKSMLGERKIEGRSSQSERGPGAGLEVWGDTPAFLFCSPDLQ